MSRHHGFGGHLPSFEVREGRREERRTVSWTLYTEGQMQSSALRSFLDCEHTALMLEYEERFGSVRPDIDKSCAHFGDIAQSLLRGFRQHKRREEHIG